MTGNDTHSQETVEATEPGAVAGSLSAVLQELARVPEADLGAAWDVWLRPGAVVGRFELVREIGRGGFGVVYEARDRELGRSVAFKAIRAGTRVTLREERLLREAEAAARLSHPNIVTLFDVGRSEHGPYLVLELLRGQTLAEMLEQGPVPEREALRIGAEVAKGLAHAHSQGVAHRDLKPANVFLCEDGQVKVLDFGLAHAFGQRRVDGGTPAYMAPEQWKGAPEDERTDVFALGVLLYRMLAGSLPFPDVLEKAATGPRPAPVLEVPDVPALGHLVGRMLAKDPVQRPRDGSEVLAALSAFQRELERTGSSSSAPVRTRRRPRMRLAGFIAAGVVAGVGLALGVVTFRGRSPAASADGRVVVAVADFANDTMDPDLDALSGLLITSLEQSRELRVLTRSRMVDILRQLGRERVDRIDESLAREVGQKAGAAALLLASVRRFEDVYALELRALDPAKDAYIVTLKEQGVGKRSIPELLDRLGERTRLALRGGQGEPRSGKAQLVTGNLEAYRHYFDGLRLDDEYLWDAAAAEYHEAVRIDPGFALAHARLAAGEVLVHSTRDRAEHLRLATSHADRLPEPDRLAVSAESEILQRRLDEAAGLLEKAVVLRPDDKRLLLRLAQVKARDGFAEARPIVERALALDPSFVPAQDLLGVTYVWTGQARKCEQFGLENARRWPSPMTYTLLNACRFWVGDYPGALEVGKKADDLFGAAAGNYLPLDLLLVGEFEGAVLAARRLRAGLPDSVNDRILANTLRTTGRRGEARRVLDAMERSGAAWMALQTRILHAAGDGDPARVRSLAVQAAPDGDLPWLALTLAFAGEVAAAEGLLQQYPLDSLGRYGVFGRTAALDVLAALRDRHRGDWGASRRRLEMARPRAIAPFIIIIDYFLGETCHLAGEDPCVVEALSNGGRFLLLWQFPSTEAYPRSLLMLARSLERLGRHQEAATTAERLLALWRHADPDLPLLAEAKALQKRLAAGSVRTAGQR